MFYNEYEMLNNEGQKISEEVADLIKPIIKRYQDQMVLRELTNIIIDTISVVAAEMMIIRNTKIRKIKEERE